MDVYTISEWAQQRKEELAADFNQLHFQPNLAKIEILNELIALLSNDDKSTTRKLMDWIEHSERILNSSADWEYKYDRIFEIRKSEIAPLMDELGVRFEWYDPDTTYEEDVRAYMNALTDFKKNLQSELSE